MRRCETCIFALVFLIKTMKIYVNYHKCIINDEKMEILEKEKMSVVLLLGTLQYKELLQYLRFLAQILPPAFREKFNEKECDDTRRLFEPTSFTHQEIVVLNFFKT